MQTIKPLKLRSQAARLLCAISIMAALVECGRLPLFGGTNHGEHFVRLLKITKTGVDCCRRIRIGKPLARLANNISKLKARLLLICGWASSNDRAASRQREDDIFRIETPGWRDRRGHSRIERCDCSEQSWARSCGPSTTYLPKFSN